MVVYPEDIIRSQSTLSSLLGSVWDAFCIEKRVQGLDLIEEIDTVSPYGTQVHLKCPSQDATIFYTLDGTVPTRRYDNVHVTK